MLWKHVVVAVLFGSALASLPAVAQENAPDKSEISFEASPPLVANTNANGVQQSSSINYGFLAGYRYFFNKHSGVELSYGYSRDTQTYGLANGSVGVKNNSDEVLAAYVFRFQAKHWTPFLLAGAGGLVFDPRTVAGASTQARLGFQYGGGADFNLKKRIFVRAEYRGVFYNSPTFNMTGLNGLDRFTHRAEPSIGFGYKF
jgi:opacity protein-like surface antigen